MNKQDQEEHMLAALAAGYEFEAYSNFVVVKKKGEEVFSMWRPKTNKANSFDLMVDCGIGVDSHIDGYAVFSSWREGVEDINVQPEYADSEHYMHAVFNCAVAIGRSMEKTK